MHGSKSGPVMSGLGQKRKAQSEQMLSASPPKADIERHDRMAALCRKRPSHLPCLGLRSPRHQYCENDTAGSEMHWWRASGAKARCSRCEYPEAPTANERLQNAAEIGAYLLRRVKTRLAQSERPEMVCPLSAFAAKRTARLTSADPLRR